MESLSSSKDEDSPGVYPGAEVPPAVRTFMSRTAEAFKDAGVSFKRQWDMTSQRAHSGVFDGKWLMERILSQLISIQADPRP